MTTREIATHLARTSRAFPLLGEITREDLLTLVTTDLGHPDSLDDFQPCGTHRARAIAPRTILHVISGNTPHAGLQTLLRGLLLGSHNLCKIPRTGAPELNAFAAALPPVLANRVEISSDLNDEWLTHADALVVFGDDDTIAHFRALTRPDQIFVAHGHRVSFGVIFGDHAGAAPAAARDASLFDQQGCLSPHLFYVARDARSFAARLAHEMEAFEKHSPRGKLGPSESAAIAEVRATAAFRAAQGEEVALWQSRDSTAWTVIFQNSTAFIPSCLNRVIRVLPLPDDLPAALAPVRLHLSTVGIWPVTDEIVARLADTGVSRICPLGNMQNPPLTWHADGQRALAPLVRWLDWES